MDAVVDVDELSRKWLEIVSHEGEYKIERFFLETYHKIPEKFYVYNGGKMVMSQISPDNNEPERGARYDVPKFYAKLQENGNYLFTLKQPWDAKFDGDDERRDCVSSSPNQVVL